MTYRNRKNPPYYKDQDTIDALHGSVKKWTLVAQGKTTDYKSSDCPLCGLYYTFIPSDNPCAGCPISLDTGFTYCTNSPYQDWARYQNYMSELGYEPPFFSVFDHESKLLAVEFREYIINLLPPKERRRYLG